MVCDASGSSKSQENGMCGRALRPKHSQLNVLKPLRCVNIACDALRCIFQHVGNFADYCPIFKRISVLRWAFQELSFDISPDILI